MSAQLSAFVPYCVLELSLRFYSAAFPPSGRRRASYSPLQPSTAPLCHAQRGERDFSVLVKLLSFRNASLDQQGRESRGNINMTSADQSMVPDSPPRARALSASLGMILPRLHSTPVHSSSGHLTASHVTHKPHVDGNRIHLVLLQHGISRHVEAGQEAGSRRGALLLSPVLDLG